MTTTVRVPNFLPSTSGLRFANTWPNEADIALRLQGRLIFGIGNAANGLCGGMSFTTADLHNAGLPVWPDPTQPPPDTDHFKYIVSRQLDSLSWGALPVKFYSMMAFRPAVPTGWGNLFGRSPHATATVRDEWPQIRASLDAGKVINIGLVRTSSSNPFKLTTSNHQVLAYGYTLDPNRVAIDVYDPNHPLDDTVELVIELTPDGRVATIEQTSQGGTEQLNAFFQYAYTAKVPAP